MNQLVLKTDSLPSSLLAACRSNHSLFRDDGTVREGWLPPEEIPDELAAEARAALPGLETQMRAAPPGMARQWLASLGTLCAGRTPVNEAQVKLAAYDGMLDYPGWCYTAETLKDAAQKFQWFPSFAEVNAFLKDVRQPADDFVSRVRTLAYKNRQPHRGGVRSFAEVAGDLDQQKRMANLDRMKANHAAGVVPAAPEKRLPAPIKPNLMPSLHCEAWQLARSAGLTNGEAEEFADTVYRSPDSGHLMADMRDRADALAAARKAALEAESAA